MTPAVPDWVGPAITAMGGAAVVGFWQWAAARVTRKPKPVSVQEQINASFGVLAEASLHQVQALTEQITAMAQQIAGLQATVTQQTAEIANQRAEIEILVAHVDDLTALLAKANIKAPARPARVKGDA